MSACDPCLRRTALVAALAARLDVEWRRQTAPAAVLSLPDDALLALDASGRVAREHARFDARRAGEAVRSAGLTAVCRCDAAYPEPLRELADPPAVLHVAGSVAALAAAGDGVAIVGARRGTPYGIEVARGLGRALAAAGVPVVSGLALGVDSAAHVGAIAAGGHRPAADPAGHIAPGASADGARPVAVLAGGADIPYPASRRRLYRELVQRGAVVSELPPGFTPYRWCFVARNRIIAGLAAATVVVEATERSGSLTTADFAEQLGRPVGAVPGPVTSRFSSGTNTLLAAGAAVIRDAGDALDVLAAQGVAAAPAGPPPAPAVPLEPRLRRLLDAIERGGGSLAELATDPEATHQVLADLTDLELRGLIRRGFGGRYVRAAGEAW